MCLSLLATRGGHAAGTGRKEIRTPHLMCARKERCQALTASRAAEMSPARAITEAFGGGGHYTYFH